MGCKTFPKDSVGVSSRRGNRRLGRGRTRLAGMSAPIPRIAFTFLRCIAYTRQVQGLGARLSVYGLYTRTPGSLLVFFLCVFPICSSLAYRRCMRKHPPLEWNPVAFTSDIFEGYLRVFGVLTYTFVTECICFSFFTNAECAPSKSNYLQQCCAFIILRAW